MVENFMVAVLVFAFGANGFYRLTFLRKLDKIKSGFEQFEKALRWVDEKFRGPKKIFDLFFIK